MGGWFALGVILSLAGDVLLMLPRDQFIAGLVPLFAHLAYIVGFNPTLARVTSLGVPLAVILALIVWRLHLRISRGVTGKEACRRIPVLAYTVVIAVMALSALLTLTRPEWNRVHALLASAGALLFLASDATAAWNRFVAPVAHGRLTIMVTYHLAQIAIASAVGLRHLAPV